MAAPFPHHYTVRLERQEGARGTLTAGPRPPILGGPPPEFDGSPEWWSPEHLLVAAASLCLLTTFQALAARAGLAVHGYRDTAEGVLEKTKEGILFTSIAHDVEIRVAPGEIEKGRSVIESAKKHCLVSNSLRAPATLRAEVVIG